MPAVHHGESGLTIVELMVAMTVGMLVVLAATSLFLSTKTGYIFQDEGARLQETGRYAIESITRAVRQAGHENWGNDAAAFLSTPEISANIAGLDASSLKESDPGIDAPLSKSINGSDVLAVRFIGSGTGTGGDGTLLNCAGFGVAQPINLEIDRGWSIFYVAADKSGEPELRCKYFGKTSWNTEAIARGIESFQVLYGIDTDADGLSNQFLTASAINKLDTLLLLEGPNASSRNIDKNRKTHWKKVVALKIAILVRSGQVARADPQAREYDLFGKDYADMNAAIDVGTRVKEAGMSAANRNRHRKIFVSTIQLRNHAAGSGT
ncbi:MAG: pilus assembly protein PilW [Burkholderiales bacterium RIFCSPLOWO2_02_FULL_57_36]|nr:MAG: pilus assembly protein PilW [Burkholderiales bacterium RIFCSPLOWO2_02_FULL_57_36]